MITSVEGIIQAVGSDFLIINVGGFGLRIFVPTSLRDPSRKGETIFLYTNFIVREDAFSLYGFETEAEQTYFDLLLGVNGIGPRTALAILSTLNVEAIRRAVLGEQSEMLARVPGVGKKTAQKIILYLQGKVGKAAEGFSLVGVDSDTEILDALTSLGYSVVEGQAAIQAIPRDAPADIETRLRIALQYFNG